MPTHRALVVTIPTATLPCATGASLRVADVVAALADAGHTADIVQRVPRDGRWCTGVAVSYASAGHLRAMRDLAPRLWLDAMDSWVLMNGSGLRSGRPSYAARAGRDAWRLLRMPTPNIATWISGADRAADRGTVSAEIRLVLPGRVSPPVLQTGRGRRAVVVGDWTYPPNAEGLRWLARQVLRYTSTTIDVYGRAAIEQPGLRLHGYVEDDADFYQSGDVHLGPVRFGAGVKRKVLQPLLAGLPVVSTVASAHGLRPHPLLDVYDAPRDFAAALDRRLALPAAMIPPNPPDTAELFDADDADAVRQWLEACPGC